MKKITFPKFEIKGSELISNIKSFISKSEKKIQEIKKIKNPTWENVVLELENSEEEFSLFMSEVSHLTNVLKDKELDDAYEESIPLLSSHYNKVGQDIELLEIYKKLKSTNLNSIQHRILDKIILSFKHSGIFLSEENKDKFNEITKKKMLLSNKFSQNDQDSTDSWSKLVTKGELEGLPQNVIDRFEVAAKEEGKIGCLLTLQFPDYLPVMQYANNRDLREMLYKSMYTTASEISNGGEYDNLPVINEILASRKEIASLLDYDNYAEYSLVNKMAKDSTQVLTFLNELKDKTKEKGINELNELKEFAFKLDGITLESFDVPYYSEKLRIEKYDINQEEIKEYFTLNKSLTGLFWLLEELFDITVSEEDPKHSYHEDLRLFKLSKNNETVAYIYADLHSRKGKRSGAWMSDYVSFSNSDTPIAFVSCNFEKAAEKDNSLLRFEEVETLFHEFGHALHHTLTVVEEKDASGISGVPWDAVELPSTFMEFFCMEDLILEKISGHYKTGEKLPLELKEKLQKSRNFQSGMILLRQLEFSITDMLIHIEDSEPYEILEKVRSEIGMLKTPKYNRFLNAFSHIFAGGYAAGYYSYKWADILSSDIFETFRDNGVVCKETASRYLDCILSKGSSKEISEMFVDFKGREPKTDAFLRSQGII
jgi:oligopeptidase A